MFRTGIEKDAGVEVRLSHRHAERVRAAMCVIVPALIALAACSPREHDGRSLGDDGASAAAQAPGSAVAPDVPAGAYTLVVLLDHVRWPYVGDDAVTTFEGHRAVVRRYVVR